MKPSLGVCVCVRGLHFREGLTAVRRGDGRPGAQVPEGEAEAGGARLALSSGAQGRQHWSRFRGGGKVNFGHWPAVLWASGGWRGGGEERCQASRWTCQSGSADRPEQELRGVVFLWEVVEVRIWMRSLRESGQNEKTWNAGRGSPSRFGGGGAWGRE